MACSSSAFYVLAEEGEVIKNDFNLLCCGTYS